MNPIRGIRFVHKAIRRETLAIEEAARSLSTPQQAQELRKQVEFFEEQTKYHTEGEEQEMFSAIAERLKHAHVGTHYFADHKVEHELVDELKKHLDQAASGNVAAAQPQVLRAATALAHHLALHIRKEEEIVVPVVEENFSPPEQGALVGKVIGTYPPNVISQTIPWIIRRVDADDRETYVKDMMHAMPPPVFKMASGWIRGGVSDEIWNDLVRRVPQLAN